MILEKLREKFAPEILASHQERGNLTIVARKDNLHKILELLKNDPDLAFEILMDVCGVDYLKMGEKPRFEVVYHLYSVSKNHRVRLRVKVPEEDMTLPTATDLWKSADWHEREAYDMFGFQFVGHPNLKRLLLFEGFEGHPLRKDYPMEKRQKIPLPEEKPT
jgi:NADH-quinone oxidoreductase subunit C